MSKKEIVSDEKAADLLKKAEKSAEKVMRDPGKLDEVLENLKKKIKNGKAFEAVIDDLYLFISLIKSYVKKEYTDISGLARGQWQISWNSQRYRLSVYSGCALYHAEKNIL